ncbi:unnamed protein product [Nesidiocoris tenuis]|uniref:Uncharacterized protein n=1 Tax=Nesidiocoris tenuis TaxID=355587 RepID=A0A6H5HKD8_9HEMI|nr:unnamed protein product [Nesidiocoris tenuis]
MKSMASMYGSTGFDAEHTVSKQKPQFPSTNHSFQAKTTVSKQKPQLPSRNHSFQAETTVSKQRTQFSSKNHWKSHCIYVGKTMLLVPAKEF